MFSVIKRRPRRRHARGGSGGRPRAGTGLRPSLEALDGRLLLSINIAIDYSYDTDHFFDDPAKRAVLQSAASVLEIGLSGDHLSAITPTGVDTWTASFPDPSTGVVETVPDLSVPADTIVVYVGGQPLSSEGGESGRGSTGGFHASGVQSWLDDVGGRGHPGALGASPTQFAPWGGSIAFDSSATNWYVGQSAAGIAPGQVDLFTVAEHELGHVLGLGTSGSWSRYVSGDTFDGPAAMSAYGGPVPLADDHDHWADRVQSDGVDAVMDPVLYGGRRSLFTDLDYAGLADVGWLVQTPSQVSTVEFGASTYSVRQQAGFARITVDRTGGIGPFTVNYATVDGTARAGTDYLATSGTLSFGIGDTSETFTVPVLDRAAPDGSTALTLTLGAPSLGAALDARKTSTLSIVDGLVPTTDDYDGDGRTDVGVFRPSTAQWLVQPSASTASSVKVFGATDMVDIPVPADYDGVGHTEAAVYRPSTGQWFIAGSAQPFAFGAPGLGDIPVPADYLGEGRDQPAVFRPSTAQWFIAGQSRAVSFGATDLADIPVPADYDGTGHVELAVFRPSTGQWFIAGHAQPINFGGVGLSDIPVPGDYDGVGHAELAVFRPSTGQWFIAGHAGPITFGAGNLFDIPLNAPIGSLLKLGVIPTAGNEIRSAEQDSLSASARSSNDATTPTLTPTPSTVSANLPVTTSPSADVLQVAGLHRKAHRKKHH